MKPMRGIRVCLIISALILSGVLYIGNLFALMPEDDGTDDSVAAKFLENQKKEKALIAWEVRAEKEKAKEKNALAVSRIKEQMPVKPAVREKPRHASSAAVWIIALCAAGAAVFGVFNLRKKSNA